MNLDNIDFSEEPLSREDLLRIKGGNSAQVTLGTTGDCSSTGTETTDCDDVWRD